MGKKDKKNDAAKKEAKKLRQSLKQEKSNQKRTKKEIKDGDLVNLEEIILEFTKRDSARTSVIVTGCGQPSPRSNFTMTMLPNSEVLMFGGHQ
jgi:hypothetical protein